MNLSQTVRLLGNILGQVLIEQESTEIFEIEEEIRGLSKKVPAEQIQTLVFTWRYDDRGSPRQVEMA